MDSESISKGSKPFIPSNIANVAEIGIRIHKNEMYNFNQLACSLKKYSFKAGWLVFLIF